MQRIIELKHVGPKAVVRNLFEELIGRLEEKLRHFASDATSVHVVFEVNGTHKLYRTSLTCHVPGHIIAAHEEDRDAGASIRAAFAEMERQIEKQRAIARHEHELRRSKRLTRPRLLLGVGVCLLAASAASAFAEEPVQPAAAPSQKAADAMRLLESEDAYQRELEFLRLEALREPSTVGVIAKYLTSRNSETRAYSLRAVAAIQGAAAVPMLLRALAAEKNSRVRRAALLGLEPFEQTDPAILPAFIKSLRDSKTDVRITAVDIVSRIDSPLAREAIRTRNKRERRRDVRRVLDMAMKRLTS